MAHEQSHWRWVWFEIALTALTEHKSMEKKKKEEEKISFKVGETWGL